MTIMAREDARPTKFPLLVLVAVILFFAVRAPAETTNTLSDAEIQGRQLAQQLCESQPAENFTNSGVLKIRSSKGVTTNIPIQFSIRLAQTNWATIYETVSQSPGTFLIVTHQLKHNKYLIMEGDFLLPDPPCRLLNNNESAAPFLSSDFSIADLGLEFFHWPSQKVLPKTTNLKRGRAYTLLESTNPNPSTNGYSRVLSWIDKESGGILEAEAYDFNGKLLKDFAPKSFKKVNGQWQLQEMEIRNDQTGSRTRLEFDLKQP